MNYKIKKLLACFVIVIMAVCVLCPSVTVAGIRTEIGTVTKVSDGDTIHVTTPEGTKLRIRMYGMDAPETPKPRKPGQPYGDVSERALAKKIMRQVVQVEIMAVDQYKRMVAVVWLGNRNINLEMVREGHAEAYREYLREYRSEFLQAEYEAKRSRWGIWSLPNYERPTNFRKRMKMGG